MRVQGLCNACPPRSASLPVGSVSFCFPVESADYRTGACDAPAKWPIFFSTLYAVWPSTLSVGGVHIVLWEYSNRCVRQAGSAASFRPLFTEVRGETVRKGCVG